MPHSSSWKERWDSSSVIFSQNSLSNLGHSLSIHCLKRRKRRSVHSQRRRRVRKLRRKRRLRRKSMSKCPKRGREESWN
jgi:hypothetical protein